MLWCHGARRIGLSNHKLKSAIKRTVLAQRTPVPDGQTEEHHGNSATIRSVNASALGTKLFARTWAYVFVTEQYN